MQDSSCYSGQTQCSTIFFFNIWREDLPSISSPFTQAPLLSSSRRSEDTRSILGISALSGIDISHFSHGCYFCWASVLLACLVVYTLSFFLCNKHFFIMFECKHCYKFALYKKKIYKSIYRRMDQYRDIGIQSLCQDILWYEGNGPDTRIIPRDILFPTWRDVTMQPHSARQIDITASHGLLLHLKGSNWLNRFCERSMMSQSCQWGMT